MNKRSVHLFLIICLAVMGTASCSPGKKSDLVIGVSSEEPVIVPGPGRSCSSDTSEQDIPPSEWYVPMGRLALRWKHTTKKVTISRIKIEAIDETMGLSYKRDISLTDVENLFKGSMKNLQIPAGQTVVSRATGALGQSCHFMARGFPIKEDEDPFVVEAVIKVTGVASDANDNGQETVTAEKRIRFQF